MVEQRVGGRFAQRRAHLDVRLNRHMFAAFATRTQLERWPRENALTRLGIR
jgi:hypothetical protein